MHIIVQEGEALVSLVFPVQAQDDALCTSALKEITGEVKVYYREYEVVRVEARQGTLEILPAAVGGICWLSKGRRYQLKTEERTTSGIAAT